MNLFSGIEKIQSHRNRTVQWLAVLYVVILFIHLISILAHFPQLRSYSKFLLMWPLLSAVLIIRRDLSPKIFILWASALALSWLGDIFLMFEEKHFLTGLKAFLAAHVFYIWLFATFSLPKPPAKKSMWVLFLLTIVYFVLFYQLVISHVSDYFVPVLIYSIVVLSMWLVAASQSLRVRHVNLKLLIGALLFVLSDSLLGYQKFIHENDWFPFLVMLTYGLAQFCLFWGIKSALKMQIDVSMMTQKR